MSKHDFGVKKTKKNLKKLKTLVSVLPCYTKQDGRPRKWSSDHQRTAARVLFIAEKTDITRNKWI